MEDKKYYEVKSTYNALRPPLQTMLYEPIEKTDKSHIGIIVMHSNGDYLMSPPGRELSQRGFYVLCANVSNAGKPLEEKMLDVKRAYEYLKASAPVDKILLWGHSGGATLMSAYQAVAENGNAVFQGDEKIYKMPDIEALPVADGMLLVDSNWGNGSMTLLSIDPAVVDEASGISVDPELDIYNPDNGYDPEGAHYSEDFIRKFMSAQRERAKRLISSAQERLRVIESHAGRYLDDEPFVIPGGDQIAPCNKLFPQDTHLLSRTKGEWTLLHGDHTSTKEIIHSVRKPMGEKNLTPYYRGAAFNTTVRAFLSSSAVLAKEDYYVDETGIYGIDYDSSYCCTPGNVKHISVPSLVMGLTAGYEFLAAEEIYHNLKSEDKTLAFVKGVNHPIMVARYMENYPNEFGDPIENMFDYISDWISSRF